MKKIPFFIAVVCCLTFNFSARAQTFQTLDEQLSFAFSQNFPDWKPEKPEVFKIDGASNMPSMSASWRKDQKTFRVYVRLFESKEKAVEDLERYFFMRQIMPMSRKIELIGDKSLTAETAQNTEISFVKGNVSVSLDTNFPRTDKNKESPAYYYYAPDSEMEFVIRAAKTLEAIIAGDKSVAPCYNDFYKTPYPPEKTNEEKFLAAAYRGETANVKDLIARNVNLNAAGQKGDTALHLAIRQGCFETIKTLIDAKIDVNAKNERKETPLMIAARTGDLETVKLLLAAGANPKISEFYDINAAAYALIAPDGFYYEKSVPTVEEKLPILQMLHDAGFNLADKKNFYGKTLLIFYLNNRGTSAAVIEKLLSFGININDTNNNGTTALMVAASLLSGETRTKTIKFLIEHGADVNLKEKRGWTAADYLKNEEKQKLSDPYVKDPQAQPEYLYLQEALAFLIAAAGKE